MHQVKKMNLNDIGTQLLYTTFPVLTENQDNTKGSATGFLYSVSIPSKGNVNVPFMVTNYHVVANAKRCFIRLVKSKNNEPSSESIMIEIGIDQLSKMTNKDLDIAIVPVAPVISHLQGVGTPVFFRSIDPNLIPNTETLKALGAIEEITFVGCPSGIFDNVNSTPLIRRGITASPIWNDFGGKPVFVIDAGVYPGSSGSPVFIYNRGSYATDKGITIGTRVFFVGIICSAFVANPDDKNKSFLGLGKVIKSQNFKDFVDYIVSGLEIK